MHGDAISPDHSKYGRYSFMPYGVLWCYHGGTPCSINILLLLCLYHSCLYRATLFISFVLSCLLLLPQLKPVIGLVFVWQSPPPYSHVQILSRPLDLIWVILHDLDIKHLLHDFHKSHIRSPPLLKTEVAHRVLPNHILQRLLQ